MSELVRCVLVGETGTGKSAILTKFVEGKFLGAELSPTNGVDFGLKRLKVKDRRFKLQICDTAGREEFRPTVEPYFAQCEICVLVYDVTRRETFQTLPSWIAEIEQSAEREGKKPTILVFGNKTDCPLQERQVHFEEVSQLCKTYRVPNMEGSALTGENIVELFYAALFLLYFGDKVAKARDRSSSGAAGVGSAETDPDELSAVVIGKGQSRSPFDWQPTIQRVVILPPNDSAQRYEREEGVRFTTEKLIFRFAENPFSGNRKLQLNESVTAELLIRANSGSLGIDPKTFSGSRQPAVLRAKNGSAFQDSESTDSYHISLRVGESLTVTSLEQGNDAEITYALFPKVETQEPDLRPGSPHSSPRHGGAAATDLEEVAARVGILPAAHVEEAGAASDTAWIQQMARLRSYVQQVREELATTMDVRLGLLPEELQAREKLAEVEESYRLEIQCTAQTQMEEISRLHHEWMERTSFATIQRERKTEALVPWCTMQCLYCCMTRLEWEKHVREQYDLVRTFFFETAIQDLMEVIELECFARRMIISGWGVAAEVNRAHELERHGFEQAEQGTRAEINADCIVHTMELESRSRELHRLHQAGVEATQLRQKQLAVLQIQDKLGLQERRVARQLSLQVVEEERAAREYLRSLEDLRRVDLAFQAAKERSDMKAAQWKAQMSSILRERDELVTFKQQTEAAAVAAEENAIRMAQLELENEFKEIKKLKKAGPPKNPPNPTCPKCGQEPAKDMFTHRIGECPERPGQCSRCEVIMKMSLMEEHKDLCPSRVLQCETCLNFYKASYLQSIHKAKCEAIQLSRNRLHDGTLKPHLPVTAVAAPGSTTESSGSAAPLFPMGELSPLPPPLQSSTLPVEGGAPTQWTLGAGVPVVIPATEMGAVQSLTPLPTSSVSTVFLRNLHGHPISSPSDLQEAEAKAVIGERVWAVVSVVEPTAEGSATHVNNYLELQVLTGCPLEDYRRLQLLVQSDEAQYCKPLPIPKGKKK